MKAKNALLLCCCALLLYGCDKPSKNQESVTLAVVSEVVDRNSPPVVEFVAKNFNVKMPTLPSDFSPDSPIILYDAITGLETSKGKFESTTKYMERMKSLSGSVLYGQVTLNGGFAFKPISDAVRISYDSDRETFSYEVRPTLVDNLGNYNCIEIERRSANHTEFPGINEYFAAKYKTVRHTMNVYLKISSMKGLGYINGTFKAKPAAAQALDGSLGVLFVGHLIPPYAQQNVKYPFDADDDVVEHQRLIHFTIDGVWFVNLRSGEILSKTWSVKRY